MNITYYPREIVKCLCALDSESTETEANIEKYEDAIYDIKTRAENPLNSDKYRLLYNLLERITENYERGCISTKEISMDEMNMFLVEYKDNTGAEDGIRSYKTEEDANKAIEEELEEVKEYMVMSGLDYDYGDTYDTTEIWAIVNDEYAEWKRLWK